MKVSFCQKLRTVYGVEAAFDLHRTKLYTALRFLLPDSTDKVEQGTHVTEYLLRGMPLHPHSLQSVQDEIHTVEE